MEGDVTVLSYDAAVKKLTEKYSCFEKVTAIQHVAIHPKFIQKLHTGVKTYLDTQLRHYSEKLRGIVVAYSNIKRVKEYGAIVDEQPHLHYDIQADYIVFRPKIGSILKGMVNKNGQDHIGLLVHNCFNASIPKPREAVNGWEGSCLALLDEVLLEVTSLSSSHRGIVSIKGKLWDARLMQNTNAARKREQALSLVRTTNSEYSLIDSTDSDLPDIKPSNVTSGNSSLDNKDIQTLSAESIVKSEKVKEKRKRDSLDDTDCNLIQESNNSKLKKRRKKDSVETVVSIKTEPVNETSDISVNIDQDTSKKKKSKKHKRDKDKSVKKETYDPDCMVNSTEVTNSRASSFKTKTPEGKHKEEIIKKEADDQDFIDNTIEGNNSLSLSSQDTNTTHRSKQKKKKKIKKELDTSFVIPDQGLSMDDFTLGLKSSKKSKKKHEKE